jgi:hypothetical protein
MKNKDNKTFFSLCCLLFCFAPELISAQIKTDSIVACRIKTLPDLFKKESPIFSPKPLKNSFFLLIPIIGAQPATGFVYGGAGQYTFKGKKETDKYSSVNLSTTYTTKKQVLLNAKNNLLIKNNRLFFSGDFRFYIFSQDNYGLGTDIIPSNNNDFDFDELKQPMDYNYFKFHQTVSWKVGTDFFVGAGIHLDAYTDIQDKNLDVANSQFTDHYNYSKKYGFSDKEYYVNGISLNLVHDSRDNQINANQGWFGNVNYRINPSFGKNQSSSSVLFVEYRYFKSLSKVNNQHVICIWTYGQFLVSGVLPYLNLPTIGGDQRSRSGRGYTQGVFRGFDLVNLETEYRFPISCNQLISGTVFANFTSTSDKDRNVSLFQYIQPAVGVGLRILLDSKTRTNLIVNYAWGHESKGFYLNAGETF